MALFRHGNKCGLRYPKCSNFFRNLTKFKWQMYLVPGMKCNGGAEGKTSFMCRSCSLLAPGAHRNFSTHSRPIPDSFSTHSRPLTIIVSPLCRLLFCWTVAGGIWPPADKQACCSGAALLFFFGVMDLSPQSTASIPWGSLLHDFGKWLCGILRSYLFR